MARSKAPVVYYVFALDQEPAAGALQMHCRIVSSHESVADAAHPIHAATYSATQARAAACAGILEPGGLTRWVGGTRWALPPGTTWKATSAGPLLTFGERR